MANITIRRFLMKSVWEKVFEYASMPLHGSLSRKLRKGIKIQVNEGKIYVDATLFLGEEFLRITETAKSTETINTYYDWKMVASVRTHSEKDEEPKQRKQKE
jgi:hypothetical protein